MLNPLAWTHSALFFLLPAVLVLRATDRTAPRVGTGAALVLASLPRETLFTLAGPLPVSPARAPLLSLHAFAGLLLFAAAAGVAWNGRLTERGGDRRP